MSYRLIKKREILLDESNTHLLDKVVDDDEESNSLIFELILVVLAIKKQVQIAIFMYYRLMMVNYIYDFQIIKNSISNSIYNL